MAFAKNLDKRNTMSYDAHNLPHPSSRVKNPPVLGCVEVSSDVYGGKDPVASVLRSIQNSEEGQLMRTENVRLRGERIRVSKGSETGVSTMLKASLLASTVESQAVCVRYIGRNSAIRLYNNAKCRQTAPENSSIIAEPLKRRNEQVEE